MTIFEKTIFENWKSHFAGILTTSLLTAFGTAIFFYFNTNNTLANHTDRILKSEMRIGNIESNINDIKNDLNASKMDIQYTRSNVSEIKTSQIQTEADIKEIYRLLLNAKSR